MAARSTWALFGFALLVALPALAGCDFGGGQTSNTTAATTPTTTATTTAPPTITPSTTAITEASTTTTAPETTWASPADALAKRATDWFTLCAAVKAGTGDYTAQIASFLPKDAATGRAAEIQKGIREAPRDIDVVLDSTFDRIDGISIYSRDTTTGDRVQGQVDYWEKQQCRDGLVTRARRYSTWQKEGDTWVLAETVEPFRIAEDDSLLVGQTATIGGVRWTVKSMSEQKEAAWGGGPKAAGMYVLAGMEVVNTGQAAVRPGAFTFTAVDGEGTEHKAALDAQQYLAKLVATDLDRTLEPGETVWCWHFFDVPEDTWLKPLSFRITAPVQT